MVYYCENCDEVFDEDDADLKDVGFWSNFWGHDVYKEEYEIQCPYCHNKHLQEAEQCEMCKEYFSPDKLDEDDLCKDCREDKGEDDDRITN